MSKNKFKTSKAMKMHSLSSSGLDFILGWSLSRKYFEIPWEDLLPSCWGCYRTNSESIVGLSTSNYRYVGNKQQKQKTNCRIYVKSNTMVLLCATDTLRFYCFWFHNRAGFRNRSIKVSTLRYVRKGYIWVQLASAFIFIFSTNLFSEPLTVYFSPKSDLRKYLH